MSTMKTALFVSALLIAGVVVFFVSGADELIASSINSSRSEMVADNTAGDDKASSCCPKSSCSKTAAASCPVNASQAGSDCAMSCAKSACTGKKAEKSAKIAPIDGREGTKMVLAGRYVCGYCDLGVSDKCQAAFRTTDGKNYLLVKNNFTKELKQTARTKDVEIVTHVQKYDGVKYLEVDVVRPIES